MLLFILQRTLFALPIALGVSILCFLLVHIGPGDPLLAILPPDASPQVEAQLRVLYGFDQPLPVQFVMWLWRAIQGDLGLSIATGRPVLMEVLRALSHTLPLAVVAGTIGFALGSALGLVAGYWNGTWVDRIAVGLGITGVSVPNYWFGMTLIVIFSVTLNWFPSFGAGSGSDGDIFTWDYTRHLALPALTMSLVPMGILVRTMRAMVADILGKDFIEALRAKGVPERTIFLHVVKNAMPTAVAVMGIQFGYLLGGSILVETVFSWPGTGLLLNSAIFSRDLPLLQGTVLFLALFFVFLNLLADILQLLLNPRMKRA